MILDKLAKQNLLHPPKWLLRNTVYLSLMGSQAYGTSEEKSDQDLYGIAIPHKEDVFPHLRGEVIGFGRQKQRFDQFQQHHIYEPDKSGQYDVTVFSIVKFFHLAMDCNPNVIDSIFVPANCVLYSTLVGQKIRENRHKFLHRGIYHRLKGYAFAQLHKITTNKTCESKSRHELIEKYGYDTKYAMHLFRLCLQCEDVLQTGDLDLQRHKDQLKAVRRGLYTEEEVRQWFTAKEKQLEQLYQTSVLPNSPDESAIKQVLLDCLEMHYGTLSDCIKSTGKQIDGYLDDIESAVTKIRRGL